jgi:TM2 domain-containing membrane protein YozV
MRDFNFQEPAPQVRYCADCGKQINPRAEICPYCGVRQYSVPTKPAYRYTPNRIVAGLLAILLVGGFGAHKFYMGQAGKGLLYLCTCWLFIPFIVAFFEGIRFLLMADDDFEAQYWH